MITLKDYIARILGEENTQGDIGTDKLSKNRKKATPGETLVTPEPLKSYTDCECNKESNK
jgi:hypothetical protein